jgi:hypothetical protein
MGSRYGRNKRRAHREQIAKLEGQQLHLTEALVAGVRERLAVQAKLDALKADVEKWEGDIAYFLGRYSALNRGTEDLLVRHIDATLRLPEPPSRSASRFPEDHECLQAITFHPIDLVHMLMQVSDEDLMNLRRYVRLKLVNASDPKDWRIAISAEMVHAAIADRRALDELMGYIYDQFRHALQTRRPTAKTPKHALAERVESWR